MSFRRSSSASPRRSAAPPAEVPVRPVRRSEVVPLSDAELRGVLLGVGQALVRAGRGPVGLAPASCMALAADMRRLWVSLVPPV